MKTVLIVDDESGIRRLMAAAVAREGYEVLEAENGVRALHVASAHGGLIHLLITDIRMPGLDGWQLAERLSAGRPGLSVIYVSGHCVKPERGLAGLRSEFLAKPFTMRQLIAAVGRMLDGVKLSASGAGHKIS
jgi:two-component system cell cycle sensor histidine kinase/response regulator CckA